MNSNDISKRLECDENDANSNTQVENSNVQGLVSTKMCKDDLKESLHDTSITGGNLSLESETRPLEMPQLTFGTHVMIENLSSRHDLNFKHAYIAGDFDSNTLRFPIQLINQNVYFCVKYTNLRLITPAPSADNLVHLNITRYDPNLQSQSQLQSKSHDYDSDTQMSSTSDSSSSSSSSSSISSSDSDSNLEETSDAIIKNNNINKNDENKSNETSNSQYFDPSMEFVLPPSNPGNANIRRRSNDNDNTNRCANNRQVIYHALTKENLHIKEKLEQKKRIDVMYGINNSSNNNNNNNNNNNDNKQQNDNNFVKKNDIRMSPSGISEPMKNANLMGLLNTDTTKHTPKTQDGGEDGDNENESDEEQDFDVGITESESEAFETYSDIERSMAIMTGQSNNNNNSNNKQKMTNKNVRQCATDVESNTDTANIDFDDNGNGNGNSNVDDIDRQSVKSTKSADAIFAMKKDRDKFDGDTMEDHQKRVEFYRNLHYRLQKRRMNRDINQNELNMDNGSRNGRSNYTVKTVPTEVGFAFVCHLY